MSSRLQIEKTQIGYFPIVFQFLEELDHTFQNLQLQYFVVFQKDLGHVIRVHYFLILVFPNQTKRYGLLRCPLQRVRFDFQSDQVGV